MLDWLKDNTTQKELGTIKEYVTRSDGMASLESRTCPTREDLKKNQIKLKPLVVYASNNKNSEYNLHYEKTNE
jgi:hypothetical protein